MAFAISPHFTTQHFQEPLSLESKLGIFSDRVRGWQLDIAASLQSEPHAGFAILAIVSSYFEMIARYEAGDTSRTNPKGFFRQGVRSVLESYVEPRGSSIPLRQIDLLYEEVRCGMYHAGITGSSIRLKGEGPVIVIDGATLTINPNELVAILQDHFSRYCARLLDASETDLRAAFEARFDHSTAGKSLGQ